MDDIVGLVKERYAKALAKVDRAEKALETARCELKDLEATLRVIGALTGESAPSSPKTPLADSVAERQLNILRILPEGAGNGLEPKELWAQFSARFPSDVTLETFRTTIWRMKDRNPFDLGGMTWNVQADNGRYWREREGVDPAVAFGARLEDNAAAPPAPPSGWGDDYDDDVPF